MINFDLSVEKLRDEFGYDCYRKGYSLIQRFFIKNGFSHHQYSGYISKSAMSYGEVYILVLDTMTSELPWLANCVKKFDATNITSQSDMLSAIKSKTTEPAVSIPSLLEGDDEIVI
ncbi:MAG: hypothetical protein LBH87_02655 [Coriobacteriales bacterium]|jgi:virulence-associated protein VapD|nr:hypothetical protein [Coriobacteriales bacterium]